MYPLDHFMNDLKGLNELKVLADLVDLGDLGALLADLENLLDPSILTLYHLQSIANIKVLLDPRRILNLQDRKKLSNLWVLRHHQKKLKLRNVLMINEIFVLMISA